METKKYLISSLVLYKFFENLYDIYNKKRGPKVYGIELNFLNKFGNQVWVIPDFNTFTNIPKHEIYIKLK